MQIIGGAGEYGAVSGGAAHWAEQLRVPDLSVGTYSIPAGPRTWLTRRAA